MCNHHHRASDGWSDVTNCETQHSYDETKFEREAVDTHNRKLQEAAYAMAERKDHCLDCGQPLLRPGHDSAKLKVSDCGLKYWCV
jgi:hypothetical protein